ncbi:hypothetical protein ACROYT_G010111 [Oculina patagonica]
MTDPYLICIGNGRLYTAGSLLRHLSKKAGNTAGIALSGNLFTVQAAWSHAAEYKHLRVYQLQKSNTWISKGSKQAAIANKLRSLYRYGTLNFKEDSLKIYNIYIATYGLELALFIPYQRAFLFQQDLQMVNPDVPFYALGADHALEQINRSMKVSGGLVGITLNPNARTKFFLIAPELAHLAEDAKEMAGTIPAKEGTRHHILSASVISREEKNVEQLITTMEDFAKSLYRAEQRSLQPCDKDWKNQSLVADEEKKAPDMEDHGEEMKVSSAGQIVELQEDRNLFARMMVICKSRPEIDIQEAVGTYEFTVVQRSMFATDGEMLHCPTKSSLMPILE